MNNPKVVVLCGSSRFTDIMVVCAWIIERDEQAITMGLHLLPGWYWKEDAVADHLAESEGVAEDMDKLHLRKIDMADEIFVVNWDDYIGKSTKKEVEYAMASNKKIRWFSHDEVGEKVRNHSPASALRDIPPLEPVMRRCRLPGECMIKVELEPGVWLSDGEGDPPRTCDKNKAKGYATLKSACLALTSARKYRPFNDAVIVSDGAVTRRCRLPGEFDVHPSDEQMEYFKRGGR